MKRVTLKSLTLCNFKGEKQRTTVFNADVTTISGGNGLGKSRHFDAFIWLLFGKDAKERKDYEIKTRVGGEELHKCECSVTGVIDVDGMEITLKRSFVEDWVKPRGQVEQVYKGNHTECWWNETPVNVTEYDKRIKEIMDSNLFKMLTNPAFFVGMKWQLQREQLFQLAGAVTDAEIATSKPEFAALMDKISGKSLADFKKEISARKKRLVEELKEIKPRIDQTQKMMPESEDFAALEAELASIDKEIADIDNSISDITAAIRKQYEQEQAKQNRVNTLKHEAQEIMFAAQTKVREDAFAANANRRELENNIKMLEAEIADVVKQTNNAQVNIARIHRGIDTIKSEQDTLRKSWFAENAKEYSGETTCPHCGQQLPDDMVAKAKEIFNNTKSEKMNAITTKGKELGEQVQMMNAEVETIQASIETQRKELAKLKEDLAKKQVELEAIPVVPVLDIKPESIPEYMAKMQEIENIQSTIITDNKGIDTTELKKQKADWQLKRNAISTRIAKRGAIERCHKEIEALEVHGKELAQQIADIEKEEYTVEQFTKTKIEECEKRINAKFKFVTFRLFEYTLDGNPVETCIPLVDGVPYGSVNTAGQVNAGLDIINALCDFYGICAPIFIDNRESVNEIIPVASQIINLVVTNDNKLTIQ